MPFPDRPAENADPWYDERETYDQAIEDAVTTAQTKLAGIATGATANDTDANLKARANHTGTQTAATISDFDTEVGNHTDVAANTAARHTHSNSAVLAATTASFLTADETKLDGIATGATANATNAELRARSSHTGTQLASTISDFASTVSAVTDVVNNTAARHTHSNSAVLAATTASFLLADETKLDGIATAATANSSDATLLARANHTGTQSADTLTDGTTNKAFLATERTKLSGIETAADVTDAANVAAAGALMTTDAPELIRDTMGTALVAGTGITVTPSDGSDTITIAGSRAAFASESVWEIGSWIYPGLRGPMVATAAGTITFLTFAVWVPIDVFDVVSVDALAVNVTTNVAASTIRLGIFTYNAGTMTLVQDASTVSGATTGARLATFTPYQLVPGQYWLGAVPSVTGLAVTSTSVPRGFNITEANLWTATHVVQITKNNQTALAAGWGSTITTLTTGTGNTFRIGIRRSA